MSFPLPSLKPDRQNSCCPGSSCEFPRRDFIKLASAGLAAVLAPGMRAVAGPFETADFEKLVPADKKLDPAWVKSLFVRGERTVYRGAELEKIGMPVGGICTGQLYLGGDGRLWHWGIFNQQNRTGAGHYAKPPEPASPLEQGFAVKVSAAGKSEVRALDRAGFSDITFIGEYPIGFVEYRDAALPVSISLEAFSPFIPLNTDDSALPATVMRFTLKNTGVEKMDAEIAGWMENAVCLQSAPPGEIERRNRVVRGEGMTFLECSAVHSQQAVGRGPARADIVFEDFEKETYDGWTVEGTAFGTGPIELAKIPHYQGDVGGVGKRAVNSHATAPGDTVGAKDNAKGKLTSREFKIERRFVTFLIGGGNNPGQTCLNLVVEGKVVRSATGKNANKMSLDQFDVGDLEGKAARIEIVDEKAGPWGNVGVDQIVFSDTPAGGEPLEARHDFGTMGLALLGDDAQAIPVLSAVNFAEGIFSQSTDRNEATRPSGDKLVGGLKQNVGLAPGESKAVTFVVSWHFPNLKLDKLGMVGRHYAAKFDSAGTVAKYIAANFDRLAAQTRLWHDTWLDSTLPHWFLGRTFANTSILATSTVFRFADGRFYSWEGVGCCPGTCTHVWHYAQAMARIFPELERETREHVDLGIGFDETSGVIGFRAEFDRHLAVDGQAGTLLRIYREHQMSRDGAFLKRNWPKIKEAFDPLLRLDANDAGMLQGAQMNTLDQPWFGKVAWLTSLYLASLRAGEAMAREMGENDFAERARGIAERGGKNILELFNGEYFMNKPDPAHPDSINSGTGCEIDQVFGQSWAWQVGLGRVLPEKETRAALQALWRYNFTPDVGPYRAVNKPGRWYAMPGEGGLLMCSFPRADWDYKKSSGKGPEWAAGYFNECMNGFEYQVAGHMIAEGMAMEGLAITRMVHDRYQASRRNPWNEVECGDHYARSMASYGVFLAACGFEHHGPRGHIGFAPKLTPENFRAPFTTAEGWGTFAQKSQGGAMTASLSLKYGSLRTRSLALTLPAGVAADKVRVTLNGRDVESQHTLAGGKLMIALSAEANISAGQTLEAVIR
ncbi:MAG TPA: GH116 family glycosyl-hydrolase [Chthoniobacter sp.]